jgi:chemotaxis protein methyltransferase CheR
MTGRQALPADTVDHLSDSHFRAIAEVIEARVGIKMPPSKRTMVEGRLRKRVRALNLHSVDDYARYVFDLGHLEQEMAHLIDCVTTNKTDFFREPAHFEFLRDVAIPSLLRDRGGVAADLKIWSAACSTGAEVYTLAMVLQEMALARGDFRFSILGTDISKEVLKEANSAIYPLEFLAAVPEPMRKRYLMTAREAKRDIARIAPELRARTRFERLNLMDAQYPVDKDVDVIFCRNVLIYFDKPNQHGVVRRLVSHLRPGGFLILGHAESMAASGVPGIVQIKPTVFMARASSARESAA